MQLSNKSFKDPFSKYFHIIFFRLLDPEDWWRSQKFDCVCMLNLLDRCSRPRSMLRDARAALTPDGLLIVALVLPYKPYVEGTEHASFSLLNSKKQQLYCVYMLNLLNRCLHPRFMLRDARAALLNDRSP